jgi:hypothetical protein
MIRYIKLVLFHFCSCNLNRNFDIKGSILLFIVGNTMFGRKDSRNGSFFDSGS